MQADNSEQRILQAIFGVKEELQELRSDVSELKTDVAGLKTDVAELKDNMIKLDGRVSNLETNVENVKLIMENDIRRDIRIVAEGHLDLSRHLTSAHRSDSEREMLKIRVNMLERDVRDLKVRMVCSA